MRKLFISTLSAILLFILSTSVHAQNQKNTPPPSSPQERLSSFEVRKALDEKSLLNGIEFRSVGPTVMSGRVVDLDVNPNNPNHFYVAYASGGLWVTYNNGTSFEPLFDDELVMTIGDIAVDWNHGETIWIGTGENNSSRSSYSGVGIYKSEDKGETWQHLGLSDSHHIGRVILHPSDPDILWVASLGHLYSDNEERGVFKTTDGGKTWKKTLYENVGIIDMVINPKNPNQLFASSWNRTRRAWDFIGSGNGSAVHRSNDGGETWENICSNSIFPQNDGTGRIGLSISQDDEGIFVYAILDNQNRREKDVEEEEQETKLMKQEFKEMSKKKFLLLDNKKLQDFLEDNGFPEKHDSTSVKELVKSEEISPTAFYEYLKDANADLFDTPVIGAEVYCYEVEKGLWKKTHEGFLDDVVYSYGYYFGVIQSHPNDHKQVYIAGVPLLKSKDGGANWEEINADNVHVDHHAIWINPKLDGHLINGNDGGVNITYDNGENYIKCNNPAVGQFYTVAVDDAEPYNIYGGLQDNGVWKGPSTYEASNAWQQSGHYEYKSIMGGDGMQIAIDTRTNDVVYTGYQFGHYYRLENGEETYFHPKHELGEKPLRWNWQTPIQLSIHNQDILYMGSNKFHRSMDKGETWETMSGDLTQGGISGNVPFGSLASISESPLMFGLLYVGSDDGLIHVSKDGGNTWKRISEPLPQNLWVSRVIASSHEKSRVYITLNGYRNDMFEALVFVSNDMGENWKRIGTDLPLEPVNVIKEDSMDKNILYVGTDHGLYVSLDGGISFSSMNNGLPAVAIHDLVIQEREQDLVIGTHGRSIYIADIEHLREINSIEEELLLFNMENTKHRNSWGASKWSKWLGFYEPEVSFPTFMRNRDEVTITLLTDSGIVIRSWQPEEVVKGINYFKYDLTIDKDIAELLEKEFIDEDGEPIEIEKADNDNYYLPVGRYVVRLSYKGDEVETDWLLE